MSDELTLHQKQALFTRLIGLLIAWIYSNGFEATFGEALRTKREADENAAQGDGIAHSLHLLRLALDLMLFRDGVYLTESADYEPAGVYWESLHSLCRWGGRFSRPDGDHFSLFHKGVS